MPGTSRNICRSGSASRASGGGGATWLRMMRPVKVVIAVVDPRFDLAVRARRQMQLAGQSAAVAGIGEHAADEDFVGGNLLAVLPATRRARVATG